MINHIKSLRWIRKDKLKLYKSQSSHIKSALFSRCYVQSSIFILNNNNNKNINNNNYNNYKFSPFISPNININLKLYRYFSNSKEETIRVPSLGDSVVEGAVANICKNVGDQIKVDDVIFVIETDKVSIDIRASKNGHISEIFKKVHDSVRVDDPLYRITISETSSTSTSTSTSTPPKPTTPSSTPSSTPSPTPPKPTTPSPQPAKTQVSELSQTSSSTEHRTPSIQFKFGKRDTNTQDKSSTTEKSQTKSNLSSTSSSSASYESWNLPSFLKRIPWEEAEIELINSGGALLWDPPKPKPKPTSDSKSSSKPSPKPQKTKD